jgi:hypothetical protein
MRIPAPASHAGRLRRGQAGDLVEPPALAGSGSQLARELIGQHPDRERPAVLTPGHLPAHPPPALRGAANPPRLPQLHLITADAHQVISSCAPSAAPSPVRHHPPRPPPARWCIHTCECRTVKPARITRPPSAPCTNQIRFTGRFFTLAGELSAASHSARTCRCSVKMSSGPLVVISTVICAATCHLRRRRCGRSPLPSGPDG